MGGYFDNNATTPIDPRVCDAMVPWLRGQHGNPSSAHAYGRAARRAVDQARQSVADLLGARAEDIVFTSSGTEANNAVIAAVAESAGHAGHLIVSSFEHPSVHAAVHQAVARGMRVTAVPPGARGVVDVDAVAAALEADTRLVCLMLANNEIGTIQPVAEVAALCRTRGIPVLTDAVQAVGKIPVDVERLDVDYLTLGAHKFHGPYGAAALWIRAGAVYTSLLIGGAQEGGRRASTENVAAVVGLGAAAEFAHAEIATRPGILAGLRDRFEAGTAGCEDIIIHARDAPRLPHTSHIAIRGRIGFEAMQVLDQRGFAVSIGAACGSGKPKPSPALLAMGLPEDEALASLRISFGITNTEDEVDGLIAAIKNV